jgi:hypothetical protein
VDLLKKLLVRLARQSPAMIVAMLALFVALTGTAVATTSALIGSAQIKNNSITGLDVKNRSLRPIDFRGSVRGPRGLRGLAGPQGPQGGQGAQGAQGIQGIPGPYPDGNLPAGKSETGYWDHVGKNLNVGDFTGSPIAFTFPLASSPVPHVIRLGGAAVPQCPGTSAAPAAQPGHLCIWETYNSGTGVLEAFDFVQGQYDAANARGTSILARPTANLSLYYGGGVWAVTAPSSASVAEAAKTSSARDVGCSADKLPSC